MEVLYYSNFCKHCNNLIGVLSKNSIKDQINFICIDNRKTKNGKKYIVLENGSEIAFPDIISSVPSMILFSRGNMLLEGDEIYSFISITHR